MRISDWSSDVCSSDLPAQADGGRLLRPAGAVVPGTRPGPAHRAGRSNQCITAETAPAQTSARSQAMSSNQPESNVANETAAPAPGNVLRILAGLHAGASRDLAEQDMILVGSGDGCDIVLAHQGVARHPALLTLVRGVSPPRALVAPPT